MKIPLKYSLYDKDKSQLLGVPGSITFIDKFVNSWTEKSHGLCFSMFTKDLMLDSTRLDCWATVDSVG